ncbi:putative clathrin assembly protein [Acorus calamus]|uniref:Clathrin assembly protein n=1 Tax=Acorus calamus TaxID=4465 RepID=A0AAV9CKB8_ACOCL|nr:putative clathrin assembly protein [Acorus calamus]
MGRLRSILGCINSTTAATTSPSSPHLAVLRATRHRPTTTPPTPDSISALLIFGLSSRPVAAACVSSLLSRLTSSSSASVSLKSLLSLHHLLRRGSFILLDQISAATSPSRRNLLNLSSFRDASSAESWVLSDWVRWYARLVETLVSSSKTLGFFISSTSVRDSDVADRVTSMLTCDVLTETESLVGIVEEVGNSPEMEIVGENELVAEVVRMAEEDREVAEAEILIRLEEVKERLGFMSFGDSVELGGLLKRLESLPVRSDRKGFRAGRLVGEIKAAMGGRGGGGERRLVRRDRGIQSARFESRRVGSGQPVRFGSARFGLIE